MPLFIDPNIQTKTEKGQIDGYAELDGSGDVPDAQISSTIARDSEVTSGALAHATTHQNAGADEISVAGLSGLLADGQTPITHATTHQNGGADEISVAGLSGLLADGQTPATHAASHQNGGADEVATATPAANAIPKAGAGGDIAEGWIPNNVGGYNRGFATNSDTNPYISTTSTSYQSISQFIFPGTTGLHGPPDTALVIGSAASDGSTSGFRIQDITNTLTIAESAAATTNVAEAIIDLGSVSNLPTGQAVFEIQIKRTTGGAARLHFINLFAT
jgi:hypothetical protein